MNQTNLTDARKNLYKLAEQTIESHAPIRLTGKKGDVVMISAEDYEALQETVYLLSVPGMAESLREASDEAIDECATLEDIGWNIK